MTATASAPSISRGRLIAARIGLVLSGLMSVPNVINGGLQLLGNRESSDGQTIPLWVGASLFVAGVITLIGLIPAWRGSNTATWAVALSRVSELTALTVFLDWFPAADDEKPFYVVIAAVGLALGLLVLCGLRKRPS